MNEQKDNPQPDAAPLSSASFSERYGLLVIGGVVVTLLVGAMIAGWMVLRKRIPAREPGPASTTKAPSAIVDEADRKATTLSQIMALGGAADSGKDPAAPRDPAGLPEFYQPQDAPLLEKLIQDNMRKFSEAKTWREKLPLVRQPQRVEEAMRDFYENRRRQEPKPGRLVSCQFFRFRGREVAHLVHRRLAVRGVVEAAWVSESDGSWKLDWESFVGAGEMDWEDFKNARPTRPVLLRALVTPDEYYNYEFEDSRRWVSLKLMSADGGHALHAFARRDSELGRRLLNADGSKLPRPVTVRVAYSAGTDSKDCVNLLEWVEDAWLLPDDQAPGLVK